MEDPDNPIAPDVDRVVRLMPGFVYVFNHAERRYEYTNRSVAAYLGYRAEERLEQGGQLLARTVHPEDLPMVGDYLEHIAALPDQHSATLEYRVLTRTGQVRWLRAVDRVFDRRADGTVLRHIGCASDVTLEKHAEHELELINEVLEEEVNARTAELAKLNAQLKARIADRTAELEETAEELEQLTFVATHDLMVPISNLSRISLLLQENKDTLDPETSEQIEWIGKCSAQLNNKISGLVLVSQLRTQGAQPVQDVCVRTCCARMLREQRRALRFARARIDLDIPRGATVRFSPSEFESVLRTLLVNARQYAEPSRPLHLRLSLRAAEGMSYFSVADNGSGLDPERDLAKVFGLFQRAHVDPPGSGIALHCARRMLRKRGGGIDVAGAKGRGATFTISLPTGGPP